MGEGEKGREGERSGEEKVVKKEREGEGKREKGEN